MADFFIGLGFSGNFFSYKGYSSKLLAEFDILLAL
jgi:hypothetical protein